MSSPASTQSTAICFQTLPGNPPGLDGALDLRGLGPGSGVYRETGCHWGPRPQGVLRRYRLLVPEMVQACYFAPFQKYAINPALDLWPEGYNQCHPLPVRTFQNAKRGGMFTLLQLPGGGYLALLPLTTPRLMAWLRGDETGLLLEAGHWGTGGYEGDAPLLAWGLDRNPYGACEKAWRAGAHDPLARPVTHLRSEKRFPEVFEYLGWCTFEEFKLEINEPILRDMIARLDAGSIPVRWFLVDDGHLDHQPVGAHRDTQEGAADIPEDRLLSLDVNRERFPNGWEPVFRAARGTKLRWLGVWLNFNGYWGGIAEENHLDKALQAGLLKLAPGQMITGGGEKTSGEFYEALVKRQSDAGFTFLKVDNQAKNVTFYRGKVENAVEAASWNHRALERAVATHLQAMINCMAHNSICAAHTPFSQVTRCSEDYKKGDLWRAKHHLNNSFSNMLWMGQTVWGDHDMFHSSDAVAGDLFARSKAISGGPIYLSDPPQTMDAKRIRPLCFEDGRILRALAPGVPLPESIFVNTYEDPDAYRVIAPLPHRCAAVAAYNLTHPAKSVRGELRAGDYRYAPGMMQDGVLEWEVPAEGVVCYDVKRAAARLLQGEERVAYEIPGFGDEFFLLCPVREGWAVIGRADKVLSPCGVAAMEALPGGLRVELAESGPFLLWRAEGTPVIEGFGPMKPLGNGLWSAGLPVKAQRTTLVISLAA